MVAKGEEPAPPLPLDSTFTFLSEAFKCLYLTQEMLKFGLRKETLI